MCSVVIVVVMRMGAAVMAVSIIFVFMIVFVLAMLMLVFIGMFVALRFTRRFVSWRIVFSLVAVEGLRLWSSLFGVRVIGIRAVLVRLLAIVGVGLGFVAVAAVLVVGVIATAGQRKRQASCKYSREGKEMLHCGSPVS